MHTSPVGYSYIRFSTPDQAKGDSLRRQTDAAADWCKRNGVHLDTGTTFRDLGRSAYTGQHRINPDRNALAAFLKLVEAGKVSRGSYLVIENLDRLSREHIQPALLLALNLLQQGIKLVQLKPSEMVFDDKSDTLPVMMMMMELSRGHGESAIKAERMGAVWAQKKLNAKNGGIVSERLPGWVTIQDGKLVLVERHAETIRHIFRLSSAGYGTPRIVDQLTQDGTPTFGRSDAWNRGYIGLILRDRRVIGEYQARKGPGRVLDGDPVPGSFPRVVSDAEFFAARASAEERGKYHGRTGDHTINVFAGLVKNARDGDGYFMSPRLDRGVRTQVLLNNRAQEGTSKLFTFPYESFKRAVLGRLAELDPREIVSGNGAADEVRSLAGELAEVEAKIATMEAELLKGDVAAIARVLRGREARKKELVELLEAARRRAASPIAEAWGETQSLVSVLDNAPDQTDAHLRLRSALRRIVSEIWLLVVPVPHGRDRMAAVQIYFQGGEHRRNYLIFHQSARAGFGKPRPARFEVRSFADVPGAEDFDLRKKSHAAKLAAVLESIDPSVMAGEK